MKARKVGYWVATALTLFAFGVGGAFDLMGGPQVTEGLEHLGYPVYLATMLGIWKLLGAVAVVVPGFPRVKEWAYAGMAFDLLGATYSHAAVGDGAGNVITPLVVLGFVVASYVLRPESRRLGPAPAPHARSDGGQLAAT